MTDELELEVRRLRALVRERTEQLEAAIGELIELRAKLARIKELAEAK